MTAEHDDDLPLLEDGAAAASEDDSGLVAAVAVALALPSERARFRRELRLARNPNMVTPSVTWSRQYYLVTRRITWSQPNMLAKEGEGEARRPPSATCVPRCEGARVIILYFYGSNAFVVVVSSSVQFVLTFPPLSR